jgi:hypothetical protein
MKCENFGNAYKSPTEKCKDCPEAFLCAASKEAETVEVRNLYRKVTAPKDTSSDQMILQSSLNFTDKEVIMRIPIKGLFEIWLKKHGVDGGTDDGRAI